MKPWRASFTVREDSATSGRAPGSKRLRTSKPESGPIWRQPSFLLTVGLCVLWLSETVALAATRGSLADVLGGLLLSGVMVLFYLGYRVLRGWALRPSHPLAVEPPLPSRRRMAASVLLVVILPVMIGIGAGVTPVKSPSNVATATSPSNGATTWAASSTTCGDWLNVMNDGQRYDLAATVLADDIANAASDQARANIETNTVDDYVSMANAACFDDSASSLVFP